MLQHVHNPVDWYSWGDEAFAKAKQVDKPIFLSIGIMNLMMEIEEVKPWVNIQMFKLSNMPLEYGFPGF